MATVTISYDGRSSTMRHLIEAMLSLGAKIEQGGTTAEQQMVKESLTTAFDELFACRNVRKCQSVLKTSEKSVARAKWF